MEATLSILNRNLEDQDLKSRGVVSDTYKHRTDELYDRNMGGVAVVIEPTNQLLHSNLSKIDNQQFRIRRNVIGGDQR